MPAQAVARHRRAPTRAAGSAGSPRPRACPPPSAASPGSPPAAGRSRSWPRPRWRAREDRRSSSPNASGCRAGVQVDEADHVVCRPARGEPERRADGGADAGRDDAVLGAERGVVQDVRQSSETRPGQTLRAMERLTLGRWAGPRGCARPSPPAAAASPSSSRIAQRSAGTASKSRSMTCRTARGAGGAEQLLAAECRTISTRFCRRSSSAVAAGLVLMSVISRAEKMRVPSGSPAPPPRVDVRRRR